jgi:hypothetical protein
MQQESCFEKRLDHFTEPDAKLPRMGDGMDGYQTDNCLRLGKPQQVYQMV